LGILPYFSADPLAPGGESDRDVSEDADEE
jgi:hypothetical protein